MSTEFEVNKWIIHDWPNIVMASKFGFLDDTKKITVDKQEKKS